MARAESVFGVQQQQQQQQNGYNQETACSAVERTSYPMVGHLGDAAPAHNKEQLFALPTYTPVRKMPAQEALPLQPLFQRGTPTLFNDPGAQLAPAALRSASH